MSLQEALEFVRKTDSKDWNLLIAEMNATRKRRDLEAANKLNVGDLAAFEAPNRSAPLEGRIIKISRQRVVLAVRSQENGFLERISVPAGMVQRISGSQENGSHDRVQILSEGHPGKERFRYVDPATGRWVEVTNPK